MSYTVNDIVTAAYQKLNVIDETQSPSAEQGVVGLSVLNDMMADLAETGVHLGWYPQTDLADDAPLQDGDVRAVKVYLAGCLATHYGILVSPALGSELDSTYTRLVKRAIRYAEANMSELPRAQAPFNYGRY